MNKIMSLINSDESTIQFVLKAEDLRAFADEIVNQVNDRITNHSVTSDDEWLTRNGVMEYLGIKATTLWMWTKKGILTPTRINRKYFYRKSDILSLQKGESNNQL